MSDILLHIFNWVTYFPPIFIQNFLFYIFIVNLAYSLQVFFKIYTPIVFCLDIPAPGKPTKIPWVSSSPRILYVY